MANLRDEERLNDLYKERLRLAREEEASLGHQLVLSLKLRAAAAGQDPSKIADSYANLATSIGGATDYSRDMASNVSRDMRSIKTNVNGAADATDKLSDSFSMAVVAASTIEGAMKGFQFTISAMTGAAGIVGTVVDSIVDLGMTIVRFPFNLWDSLFKMAANSSGGTEYRQALEDIRKAYGDLSKGASKAIWDMQKSMHGALAESKLSVYRIFGNRADVLKWTTEVAKSLGNMFQVLSDKGALGGSEEQIERFGVMYKGLGVTEEGMKAIGRTALLSGKTVVEEMTEMTNYAVQMGDAFGINAKEIGKDMQTMEADLAHFAGMTKKSMAAASIYVHKLGMDIKDLNGLLDTFSNLDSAMEASAKVNQTLGLKTSGLEMMNAAAKDGSVGVAEVLRKNMKEQGFSIAGLDRLQLNMMASTFGLTQEQLKLLDSQKNQGASMDQLKKKGEDASKHKLSQAEATEKLANSVERLVKSGQQLQDGLFKAFFEGFQQGIFRTREFRHVLMNIKRILYTVTRAGRAVGRAFVHMFPGVKTILGGLAELFEPGRWRKMMRKVVDVFKDFFKLLQTDPESGLKSLFTKLRAIFFDHFDSSKGPGMKIIQGYKTFFITLLRMAVGGIKDAIPMIMSAIAGLIKGITNTLKGGIPDSIKEGSSGMLDQFMFMLGELWKGIKAAWPELRDALIELMSYLGSELKAWALDNKMLIVEILGVLFAPIVIGALLGALTSSLTMLFTNGIKAAVSNVTELSKSSMFSSSSSSTSSSEAAAGSSGFGGPGGTGAPMSGSERKSQQDAMQSARETVSLSDEIKAFGIQDAISLGAKLVAIAAAISIGMMMFAAALIAVVFIIKKSGLTFDDVWNSMKILLVGIAAMTPVFLAVVITSAAANKIDLGSIMKTILIFSFVGVMAAAIAGLIWLTKEIIGNIKLQQAQDVAMILGFGGLVMAATGALMAIFGKVANVMGVGNFLLGSVLLAAAGVVVVAIAYLFSSVSGILGDVSMNEAKNIILAMSVAGLVILATLPLIAIMAVNGALLLATPFVLGGFLAVGGMIYGIAKLLEVAKDNLKGITGADALNILTTITMAVGVIILITASMAVLAASAVVAGVAMLIAAPILYKMFDELKDLIPVITGAVTVIMLSINALPPINAGFQSKVDVFVQVIHMMMEMMLSLSLLVAAGGFSVGQAGAITQVGGLFKEGGPMTHVKDIVDAIKGTVVDVLNTIGDVASRIDPSRLEVVKAIAPIVNTVVELMKALQPSQSVSALVSAAMPVSSMTDTVKYMEEVKSIVPTLIGSVLGIMLTLSSIPSLNINTKGIEAFASIMGAIGSIMGALGALMDNMKDEVAPIIANVANNVLTTGKYVIDKVLSILPGQSEATMGSNTQVVASQSPVQKLVDVMGALMGHFTSPKFLEAIESLISSVSRGLSGLNKEQLSGIGPMAGILTGLFSFIQSVTEAGGGIDVDALEAAGNMAPGLREMAVALIAGGPAASIKSIGDIMGVIAKQFPIILNSLISAVSGVNMATLNKAAKAAEVVTAVLGSFTSLMKIVSEIGMKTTGGSSSGASGGLNFSTGLAGFTQGNATEAVTSFDPTSFTKILGSVSELVQTIFVKNGGLVKDIVDGVANADFGRIPKNLASKVTGITAIFDLLKILADSEFQASITEVLKANATDRPKDIHKISAIAGTAKQIISEVGGTFGTLFKSGSPLLKALSNITPGKVKQITQLSTVIENISTIAETLADHSAAFTGAGMAGVGKVNAMLTALEDTPNKINAITAVRIANLNSLTTLQTAISGISTISEIIAAGSTSGLSSLGPLNSLRDFLGGTEEGSDGRDGTGLIGMISSVNNLNQLLGTIKDINLAAKLQDVAGILSMNGEKLVIQNESFNITLNVKISMNVADVENIIVDRAWKSTSHGTGQSNIRKGALYGPSDAAATMVGQEP